MPVLEALQGDVPVSIDTAKAEVARRAIELGAELVNDVTRARGATPSWPAWSPTPGAYLCLMHMQGEPRTMQVDPTVRRRRRRGRGVPRGAAALRRRRGHPRGAHLPRPGLRVRQDRRAELRAARGGSARSSRSGGRSSSASRASARSGASSAIPRRPPARCRRASPQRSRPTSEARRSSASTTSASTSRR